MNDSKEPKATVKTEADPFGSKKNKGKKQISLRNDNQRGEGEKQIPFGKGKTKRRRQKQISFGNDN